jgi:dTDP-4-dehydrorhamnose reductase
MNIDCLIFGANGMLGKYICKYLEMKGKNIVKINRKEFDIKLLYNKIDDIIFSKYKPKFVINCAGVINKRLDLDVIEMYIVNSVFPQILSKICVKYNICLIHPTTDCVFSGLNGNYDKNSKHDCNDDYGISKSIGENIYGKNICVIRSSIIGEEDNSRSLISWIISNKDKTVNGYTNHLWNGITCLEYAKIVYQIILNGGWTGLYHINSVFRGQNFISKNDLVKIISEIYMLNITIIPMETIKKCDRTLKGDISTKDIYDQIIEMHDFLRS